MGMKALSYTVFDSYMKHLPAELLKDTFEDVTKAHLMRSIIINEKQFYQKSEPRTLRSVWYSIVKPVLDKLGYLDDSDRTDAGLARWDATLSKYMGQLLRDGQLLYSDLGIEDTSRRRETSSEFYYTVDNEIYGYKGGIAPYPNIIIVTEKDTAYNVISKLSQLYGCSCISAKGQNALGAMESLVRGIVDKVKYYDYDFETIYILAMTDYDPAGYYIADAIPKQCKDILRALGEEWINVEYSRIGITPDQLDEDMVINNMYTPKPANMDKWMDKTGGVNGMRKGLELDALSFDEIRSIFVDAITPYIDLSIYKEFIKSSYIKMEVLSLLKPLVNRIYNAAYDELETQVKAKNFSVHSLAKQGERSIRIGPNVQDMSEGSALRVAVASYLSDNIYDYESASDLLDEEEEN